jgi:hypothetical protein
MPEFNRFLTAQSAITAVMKRMGLTPPSDVFATTDRTGQQFFTLANEVGLELMDRKTGSGWSFLTQDFSITTELGVSSYTLPDDFDGFVQDSQWNRTTRLPAIGSMEEYEWQMLKARALAGTTFTMLFRIVGNSVEFYDTPSTVQTIVMPYRSRGWCTDAPGTTRKDNLSAADDIILYDPTLFKAGLKRAWYIEKQFDTARVEVEYLNALAAAKAKDSPGRTLSLSRKADYPYLGVINIPDTGFGGA